MDLPASVFLGLMDRDDGTAVLEQEKTEETEKGKKDKPTLAQTLDVDEEEAEAAPIVDEKPKRDSVYDQIAALAGEPDYETYWERHFEQLRADDT